MQQIPLREFFKNPTKKHFVLSPNGKLLAFLDVYKKRSNIFVQNLATNLVEPVTTQQRRNIRGFQWKNSDVICYLQDEDGNENDHVFVVHVQTKAVKDITPHQNVKVMGLDTLNEEVYLKNTMVYQNQIMYLHNRINPRKFDLYLYDLSSNKEKLVQEFAVGEFPVAFSKTTVKPLFVSKTIPGGQEIYRFENAKKTKVKFVPSRDHFEIVEVDEDKQIVYVLTNENRDKVGLFRTNYDLKTGDRDLVYESQVVDLDGVWSNFQTSRLECVLYQEQKREVHYLDQKLKKVHGEIQEQFFQIFPVEKNSVVLVRENSLNKGVFFIDTISDCKPQDEYIYFQKTNSFQKLSRASKYLVPENLSPMKPISYKARDGLTIHGYLTLPRNSPGPVPVVVNPHGGPWVRDTWGFNPEVQFLASRGFGVLQVNFRISTGYGKKHFTSGWHQWGLACQDDVTDGTKWLVENNYAPPKQIAIYGGSYGGYATLMGIVREPDLYAAAVDYVGVSDLFSFWDGIPEYWKVPGNIFEEAMGNPHDDPEKAKRVSPVYHVDKIKTPLLVVQGANDPRVPQKQADLIVHKLRERGTEVKYMLKKDEGHGFQNENNRFELYGEMIRFLDQHLKK